MLTQKELLRHKQLIIHRIFKRFYLLKTTHGGMIQDERNNGSFTTQIAFPLNSYVNCLRHN